MSKTLVGILETAALVGVSFLGGPIGAVLGTSARVGALIGTVAVGLVEVGLNATVFKDQLPRPDTTESAIKSPTPPRVSAYGKSRLPFSMEYFE